MTFKPPEKPKPKRPPDPEACARLTAEAQHAKQAKDWPVAEAKFREALEATEASFDADDDSVAAALGNLGAFLAQRGRYDAADGFLERALDIYVKRAGPDDASSILIKSWLADNARMRYKLPRAEKLCRECLASSLSCYGPDHAQVAVALNNLAGVLTEQARKEKYAEAVGLGKRALALARRHLGDDHPKTRAYAQSWGDA
mmetsp:Transcript_5602/g.16508  ORF Transcript_5602/g.16508 Transcript_5602/m.16508 type:complete len:201 (+) Transcript_5602:1201-1803(+)